MRIPTLAALATLAALVVPAPTLAAETCTGTIASLPAAITTPGTWCLARHLGATLSNGTALKIAANDVTVDCRGFRISHSGASSTSLAIGIGLRNKRNATVRNCRVRGFHTGVSLEGNGYGHLVENMAIEATARGIVVQGDGSRVRGNTLLDIGGSTSAAGGAWGIVTTGGVDLDDNLIDGISAQPVDGVAVGAGVVMYDAGSVVVQGNRIRRVVGDGGGYSAGVRIETGAGAIARGNQVGQAGTGIDCADGTSIAVGNDFSSVGTPVTGCTVQGDQVVTP